MSKLQNKLRNGLSTAEIHSVGVDFKTHNKYPNLYLFKYNLDADFSVDFVRECRGIILDASDNWRIVSRGFDKFFNYGEPNAAEIDWESACFQEKLDGSLMVLYWYAGEWHVQTSGTPDASGHVHGNNKTFHELFFEIYPKYTINLDCSYCYMFELTSPLNRIVVNHVATKLTLLGIRDLISQKELTYDETVLMFTPTRSTFGHMPFPLVPIYPLNRTNMLSFVNSRDPFTNEGLVVCDKNFNRVKIKSDQYVQMHHIGTGTSTNNLWEVARKGETAEVLVHFPQIATQLHEIQRQLLTLNSEILNIYTTIKTIPVQKDFAVQALKYSFSGCLFELRKGTVQTPTQWFAKIPLQTLKNLVK